MKRVGLIAAVLGVVASSGCARNAFLELTIELPPNPHATSAERYAVAHVMYGTVDFKDQWGGDNPIPPVLLDPVKKQLQKISVESNAEKETAELRVKVRFCKQPNCLAIGPENDDKAPEAWLRIDRAFYIGKRTAYLWVIECIPANPDGGVPLTAACKLVNRTEQVVTKCLVQGCRSGDVREYCFSGKHFCESD